MFTGRILKLLKSVSGKNQVGTSGQELAELSCRSRDFFFEVVLQSWICHWGLGHFGGI